jgi:AAA domain, putative AbiEii toxin, Type IV TA system/AAA ATPase domain
MKMTCSPIGGRLPKADDKRRSRRQSRKKMIRSIHIECYRGFCDFSMEGLGRVNLLVGKNNSGKTSVLEAILLLTSRSDVSALMQILSRRGERFIPAESDPRFGVQQEFDVCHLFNGHEVHPLSSFTVSAENESPKRSVTFTVTEPAPEEVTQMRMMRPMGPAVPQFVLHISGNPQPFTQAIPILGSGGIPMDILHNAAMRFRGRNDDAVPTRYISTESLTVSEVLSLWDKLSLTPNEKWVLDALKFLSDDIERVASISAFQQYFGQTARGGFKIKLRNSEQPIPIGSMGDGMWRMLSMAIAITQSKGGVLLVDEIDTGLHYSVMAEMWKLIYGAAKEFDVQVFATTHSYDCVHSLARICGESAKETDAVRIHRIETGKSKSVPFTEREIMMAADRNIEIR